VPALAAAGYRVITWDTRGFGNSTCRQFVLDVDASVRDLSAVLDQVGAEEVDVVGQSMGGWWALGFALAHRTRVRSLTLANTFGGLWTDAIEAHFRTWVNDLRPEEPRLGEHAALGEAFAERDPAHAFLYQQLHTFHAPPMDLVTTAIWQARVEHAAVDALALPLLFLFGNDDRLFPAPLLVDTARRLADAKTHPIADAGHSAYFERPDAFNDALLAFLAAVPAS
jgi:pimeloyl-ACP methyl ester carboxylesterase